MNIHAINYQLQMEIYMKVAWLVSIGVTRLISLISFVSALN